MAYNIGVGYANLIQHLHTYSLSCLVVAGNDASDQQTPPTCAAGGPHSAVGMLQNAHTGAGLRAFVRLDGTGPARNERRQ